MEKMSKFAQFVCSDGITPLNTLLGVLNTLIYVSASDSASLPNNTVDESESEVESQLCMQYTILPP